MAGWLATTPTLPYESTRMMSKKKWKMKVLDFLDQTKRIIYNMTDPDDFAPTAMMAKGEKIIVGVVPTDKYSFYEIIGNLAFQHQTECIATAMVSWFIPPDGMRDEDKVDGKWVGPMPSKHPNREEAVIIWAAHGKEQFGHMAQFTRKPNRSVLKYTDVDLGSSDDEDVTLKNYLWDSVVDAMRDKDFKP